MILLLGTGNLAYAAGSEQTHNTVPQAGSSFLPDLQAFLKQEDAKRFGELFVGTVTSGGTHSTIGSLTATPADLIAYPGGYYTTQTGGSVTYNATDTCWVIVNKDLTGNLSNFTRSAGTHYLVDCASASKPALPSNSAWLMEVTTNSSSVTAVTDLRTRAPDMPVYLQSELPAAGTRGRTAFVRDYNTGTIFWDTGVAWVTVASNPMTAAADLIVGGASGIPARLAKGTANQVLGMNSGATAQEYKTVVAGSGISVDHTTNTITVTQTVFPPAGSLALYAGNTPPTSWLLCDGSSVLANTYPNMSAVLIPNASTWGRGVKVGDFTCDVSTDICTLSSHGLINTQIVHVATTSLLPAGLFANTVYYIRDATLSTFKLTTTSGGTAVDIISAGIGTHSLYDKIQVPDMRGRAPVGSGTGSGLSARTLGQTTGSETISVAALPTHGHVVTDPGHTHTQNMTNAAGGASTYPSGITTATTVQNAGVTDSKVTGVTIDTDSCTSCLTAADGNMSPSIIINFIIKT